MNAQPNTLAVTGVLTTEPCDYGLCVLPSVTASLAAPAAPGCCIVAPFYWGHLNQWGLVPKSEVTNSQSIPSNCLEEVSYNETNRPCKVWNARPGDGGWRGGGRCGAGDPLWLAAH